MDLEIYRARIGLFNLRKCVGKSSKLKCCRVMSRYCGKILLILEVASLILAMIVSVDVSSGGLVENDCLSHLDPGLLRLSNNLPYLARGPIRVQNYQLKICDWNAYMKAMNGNKTCLDVAHWNGGSSHLGKSSKGREKLLHAKFLLSKYNLDVFGLSEANLHKSVNGLEYKNRQLQSFPPRLKNSEDCNICKR